MFNSFPSRFPDSGGGFIKSAQNGRGSMPNATTQNVPISPVDPAKSVVLTYSQGSYTNLNVLCVQGILTSPTNLQLSTNAASTVNYSWQVIEFASLKSFQSGNFSAVQSTVTISPVKTEKSIIFFNYKAGGSSTLVGDAFIGANFNSPTQIVFYNGGALALNVNWYVIELP